MNDTSKIRIKKEEEIDRQLQFCMQLILKLGDDFNQGREKQQQDSFYKDRVTIEKHSRYAADTIRLRRELNTLREMFERG